MEPASRPDASGEAAGPGPAPPDPTAPPPGPAPPPAVDQRRRPMLILLSVVVGVGIIAVVVLWRTRGPAGTTQRAHLEWTCTNLIFWPTPDPVGGFPSGPTLWAGEKPVRQGPIQTGQGPGREMVRHWADGSLYFETDDRATFTSDAGGTMVLTRLPETRFFHATCSLIDLS